jgi:hypothetical protein
VYDISRPFPFASPCRLFTPCGLRAELEPTTLDLCETSQVIPNEGRVETFGGPFEPRRKFKWLRAVVNNDGDVFGIPAHGLSVLRIRPTTDEVHTFGEGTVEEGKWMCHGAGIAANSCIYGIPSNGSRVLKVEVETSRVSYIGEAMPGGYKWCVMCPLMDCVVFRKATPSKRLPPQLSCSRTSRYTLIVLWSRVRAVWRRLGRLPTRRM